MSTEQAPVSKEDIESKFRQIKDEVDTVTGSAKDRAVPFIAVGGILFAIIFYLLGRRVGKKRSATVEIRRI